LRYVPPIVCIHFAHINICGMYCTP
jgi:hypothetical protein